MIENLEKIFSRRHIEARLRLCVWSISEDCILYVFLVWQLLFGFSGAKLLHKRGPLFRQ